MNKHQLLFDDDSPSGLLSIKTLDIFQAPVAIFSPVKIKNK